MCNFKSKQFYCLVLHTIFSRFDKRFEMKKSILITGCSSGIGSYTAQYLHQRGYRVFATARKQSDVDKLKNLGLESLQLDLDNSNSINKAVGEILDKTNGTLYALFNNAGYGIPGAVEDLNRNTVRKQFESIVFGPIELTNLILPVMRKQGYGRIIQNGSILGIITMPFRGAYCASKFALEAFNNTLRQELHGTQIFVSIIEPGPIKSEFRKNAHKNFQNALEDKSSIFENTYKNMEKEFLSNKKEKIPFSLGPEAVAKKITHALESTKPKAHYYIGFPAHLFAFLRRILPDSALDWVIRKSSSKENEWQAKQK